MKKLYLLTTLIVIIGNTATAQKIYDFKPWQCSFSAMAGTNYTGIDFSGTLATRISTGNFGAFLGLTYGNENVKAYVDKIYIDDKEPVRSTIIEAGGKYSFYKLLAPFPINMELLLGLCYNWENSDLIDDTEYKHETLGNVFGFSAEYFLNKNFSLVLKQNVHYLYDSRFGDIRSATLLGITINF